VPVAGTLRFRQISAGFASTCAVTTDYRAYCWGTNDLGQLGDGTTDRRLQPAAVAGGLQFREVQTTFQHACGVTYSTKRGYCWGGNRTGELGVGSNTGPEIGYYGPYSSKPVAVIGTLTFRQVSPGYNHSCGVTTDNRVFCWGYNRYGQVGDSSTGWKRFKPSQVAGTRQYRQVDAGRDFACAVTTGNRVFCWGYGAGGVLGNGSTSPSRWPKPVSGGLSVGRVTAGDFHTCAETTTNRAYCWGYNNGSVGDGTFTARLTPVAVGGGLSFSQLSAGNHTCGRTPDGVAYCWGAGFDGELGTGALVNSTTPVPVSDPM
jgi:alpha-tubulin suppressor-like RCC1 family protein